MKVLVFGGTTEGRKLSRLLQDNGAEVVLSVATAYGKSLADKGITVYSKRQDADEMTAFISKHMFDYVIDTTHPYANIATQNIQSACETVGVRYLRLIRECREENKSITYAPTASAAAEMLRNTSGNILLTIGSKELQAFTNIENYAECVYVRMLPMLESLQKAQELGFKSKNIICMQGPFDFALNKAMLSSIGAAYMVTKDSGDAGGFADKVEAAVSLGCKVIVIARPTVETGLTYNEMLDLFGMAAAESKPAERLMFPLFFDLQDKPIAVVGGGKIAERRVEMLLKFGASVILISPSLTASLQNLSASQMLTHIACDYNQSHLQDIKPFLVIATTNNRDVNHTVMLDAKQLGIPHIIADCKEECDVYFPATVDSGGFIAGIISKDGNHSAVKDMAQRIRRMFDDE